MEERFPVIIDGENCGELFVGQDGLMTVFRAQCRDIGEVVRLSVYGECEGYLGVMVPENGCFCLKKSLSRSSMESFPKNITHAGRRGEPCVSFSEEEESEAPGLCAEEYRECCEAEECENITESADKVCEAKPPEQMCSSEVTVPEGIINWRRDGTGALKAEGEDGRTLYALPAGTPGIPADKIWMTREIEGREYMILQIKNGKIL